MYIVGTSTQTAGGHEDKKINFRLRIFTLKNFATTCPQLTRGHPEDIQRTP